MNTKSVFCALTTAKYYPGKGESSPVVHVTLLLWPFDFCISYRNLFSVSTRRSSHRHLDRSIDWCQPHNDIER